MITGFTKTETALLDALERERALLRQRDLINGIIVHEMANAVTVVASTSELLRSSEPRSPMHQFALLQLRGGVQALNEMIRGLRVLLEGEGEPPKFTQGDLTAFVQSVVADPVLVAETAGGRITLISRSTASSSTYCPALLRHAIGNLVRNALKYSVPDSRISVAIGARGDRQWIHVLNYGPKIGADLARHLFEPGKKSARGGMGLGLHITRACALRMSGQLVYGSTQRATVFSLLLPRREPAAEFLSAVGHRNQPETPPANSANGMPVTSES
jgi:signal transduction histidine kinase